MHCATCGTEIAEKALICFRCGAATAPRRREAARAGRRGRWWLWVVLLGFVVLGLMGWMRFGDRLVERFREPDPAASERVQDDARRRAAISGFEGFHGLAQTGRH